MIAYLDSSVLLRFVLGQADMLDEWEQLREGITSSLTQIECLRTLDRRRVQGLLAPAEFAERRGLLQQLLGRTSRIEMTRPVLDRAAAPFPMPVGTLDAIHLATALVWRRAHEASLVFATHDLQLGLAARAEGFDVYGT